MYDVENVSEEKISMDERTKIIRLRAHELCRENLLRMPQEAKGRKDKIIQILMKEFGLSYDEAEYHFYNNNEEE